MNGEFEYATNGKVPQNKTAVYSDKIQYMNCGVGRGTTSRTLQEQHDLTSSTGYVETTGYRRN